MQEPFDDPIADIKIIDDAVVAKRFIHPGDDGVLPGEHGYQGSLFQFIIFTLDLNNAGSLQDIQKAGLLMQEGTRGAVIHFQINRADRG